MKKLILLLKNFNLNEYSKMSKKTFILQKIINSCEELEVIADFSLKEIISNIRIDKKMNFYNINTYKNELKLQTDFNFELICKLNNSPNTEIENIFFFDDNCLEFESVYLDNNFLFEKMKEINANFLLMNNMISIGRFFEMKGPLKKHFNVDETYQINFYEVINSFYFCKKKIIDIISQQFYEVISNQKNEDFKNDESLVVTKIIQQNPKIFTIIYTPQCSNLNLLFRSYFMRIYSKNKEELMEFYGKLNNNYNNTL
jgi:hypothetical protein